MKEYRRIRDLREDTDRTQEQIAKLLKMHTTQYCRYERGERKIPIDFIEQIADLYNVSIDYICERTNNKKVNK